jgi:hypothetical protein
MDEESTQSMPRPGGHFAPLVLLDVDGTINAIAMAEADASWPELRSHGYRVRIPNYMPGVVQGIAGVAEIHWCSTWRGWANDEIADHLGVGPFPVVDDGSDDRGTGWKAAAAHDLAAAALGSRRRVIWFEDFYGDPPVDDMPPGVEFVDTAAGAGGAVLTEEAVLEALPEIAVADLWAQGRLYAAPEEYWGWDMWREIGEGLWWPGVAGAHLALHDLAGLLGGFIRELDLRMKVEDRQPAPQMRMHEADLQARNRHNHEVVEAAMADVRVAISLLRNASDGIVHRWPT